MRSYAARERQGEVENGPHRKRHESRMDSRTKVFGGDATRGVMCRNCGKNGVNEVTREVVWIVLTIIKGERQDRLEFALVRWRLRREIIVTEKLRHWNLCSFALNQIRIRDSERAMRLQRIYVKR